MTSYVVLLRGINVGGKNKVSMASLRQCLNDLGFSNVSTYIASGNVLLQSRLDPTTIQKKIEQALPKAFRLDSNLVRVLVLTPTQLETIVEQRPAGFGSDPTKYHSDVIFLLGITKEEALAVFNPREGVDKIWPGKGVIYSQRLSAARTKSRLNTIMASPLYQSMTIRNWATTTKLLTLLKSAQHPK